MKNSKLQAIMAMYGLACLYSQGSSRNVRDYSERDERLPDRKVATPYKGMKPFTVNGTTVWALNQKNAERKYKNQNAQ